MGIQKAFWISGGNSEKTERILFRRDFWVTESCTQATISIAAGYRYVLWINGREVSFCFLRSHPAHKEYDVYDITNILRNGRNSIAVMEFFSPSAGFKDAGRGLILQAEITTPQHDLTVITDENWLFCKAAWYDDCPFTLSSGTELQEHINSIKIPKNGLLDICPDISSLEEIKFAPRGWHKNYEDGFYHAVFVLGGCFTPPWFSLQERSIPTSILSEIQPKLVWSGKDDGKMYAVSDNLAIKFNEIPPEGCKASNADIIDKSVTFSNTADTVFVFDFYKISTVRPEIIIRSYSGNGRIELYYNQSLELPPKAARGFGSAKEGFCDSFVPSAADQTWKLSTARGFRFMIVRISGACKLSFSLNCKVVEYPFSSCVKLPIESTVLSKVWDIAANTIKSSTTDYYIDTCMRENALWTFDACVTGKAAYDTFKETRMWKRSLLGIAYSVNESGYPQSLAVPGAGNMLLLDQNLFWVNACLDYFETTGDVTTIRQLYPAIVRLLSYCNKFVGDEDLFVPPAFSWHYIDWAKIDRRPYSLPVNALYIMANNAAAKLAVQVDKSDSGARYEQEAERVRTAAGRFFDAEAGAFLCHIEPEIAVSQYNHFSFTDADYDKIYKHSIHANSLAILAKIGSKEMRSQSISYMLSKLCIASDAWCQFGPGWTYTLLQPLLLYGKKKEVVLFLEQFFEKKIIKNPPTFGESWNAGIYNSGHGWGSCVNSLLKEIYG